MTVQLQRPVPAPTGDAHFLHRRLEARAAAAAVYFAGHAPAIAACAAAMADRFFDGATLLVLGSGSHAADAQHNAVEYLHPVLPGCRALPAIALADDGGAVTGSGRDPDPAGLHARRLRLLGRRGDIALAFAADPLPPPVGRGLAAARGMGMLTVVLVRGAVPAGPIAADHVLAAGTDDPLIAEEIHLATYHMLWELVHIVLNHRGIRTAPGIRPATGGAPG